MSAAALRNERVPFYRKECPDGAVPEESHHSQALDRQTSLNESGHHLRHTRVASEGAMRALDRSVEYEMSARARPKSQLSFVNIRKVYEDGDRVHGKYESSISTPRRLTIFTLPVDKAVHYDPESARRNRMAMPQTAQIRGERPLQSSRAVELIFSCDR